jgi:hypothetical protein
MIELGRRLGLLAESMDLVVRCQIARQHRLQGHGAPQTLLPREIDHAHAATGNLSDHKIITKRNSDLFFAGPQVERPSFRRQQGESLIGPAAGDCQVRGARSSF